MKTTIDTPDDLFRQTKATAALRGERLKDFVNDALRARLDREAGHAPSTPGWRSAFGRAKLHEVEPVDAVIAKEFAQVDPREWK